MIRIPIEYQDGSSDLEEVPDTQDEEPQHILVLDEVTRHIPNILVFIYLCSSRMLNMMVNRKIRMKKITSNIFQIEFMNFYVDILLLHSFKSFF